MGRAWLLVSVACGACGTDPGAVDRTCWPAWLEHTIELAPPADLAVSSPVYDRDPSLAEGDLALYLSSSRAPSQGADLWVATRASTADAFGDPVLDTSLSSPGYDSKISFTADALHAVLASTRDGGQGGSDVWETERATTSDAWAPPSLATTAAVNSVYDDFDPHLSSDGLRVYLAPWAPGRQHLAVATRGALGEPFSAPAPILELDSGTGDGDPTLSPDDMVIVFSSARAGSAGNGNLWYATRAAPGAPFDAPEPVPDVNGDANEGDAQLARDGCTLYFASDRSGDWDIYAAAAVR